MERDLVKVIDAMLDENPRLRESQLPRVRFAACFTAPEAMGIRWQQALDAMLDVMPVPETDAEVRAACVFGGSVPSRAYCIADALTRLYEAEAIRAVVATEIGRRA
jgi:hypothetical protein